MHRRPAPLSGVLLAIMIILAGCGSSGEQREPGVVPFLRVVLPEGGVPLVLAAVDDALLVGVRRDGAQVVPGLLRRGPDGAVAEVAVNPATPDGRVAEWVSLAADGERVVAVGEQRGGARWSVWSGTDAGIAEQPQAAGTFDGDGALVGAALTPAGPVLVGTWQSARAGLDIAVWAADGARWVRHASGGTALENSPTSLKFPVSATALRQGIAVAGWEQAMVRGESRQRPTVWRSEFGAGDWTMSHLPKAGDQAAAVAIRCWEASCTVAGRSDGVLAVWRLADGAWSRAGGVPRLAVDDDVSLTAPVEIDGRLTVVIARGDEVAIVQSGESGWTTTGVSGPAGPVTAVTMVGRTLYVIAGEELWSTDVGPLAG